MKNKENKTKKRKISSIRMTKKQKKKWQDSLADIKIEDCQ